MKRVLFDINVILDVLLDREPSTELSSAMWAAAESGALDGLLAGHAVTTIHYLIRKEMGAARSRQTIAALLSVFGVAAVDRVVIHEALQLPCPDFEDAVTAAAARTAACECIVTRDPKGFRGSTVRCLTPEQMAPLLQG